VTTSSVPGEAPDPEQRAEAARIEATSPQWVVLWGCGSRRFWGFPLFAAPRGTIVSAADTATLLARMRQAETASAPGPAQSSRPQHL